MTTLKYKVETMQAALVGASIEYYERGKWTYTPTPSWNWTNYDYRIINAKEYTEQGYIVEVFFNAEWHEVTEVKYRDIPVRIKYTAQQAEIVKAKQAGKQIGIIIGGTLQEFFGDTFNFEDYIYEVIGEPKYQWLYKRADGYVGITNGRYSTAEKAAAALDGSINDITGPVII